MPNKLIIPSKASYKIDVNNPVRHFIKEHTQNHPDEFKWDISHWQKLRDRAPDSVDASLAYHAQLVSILTKLPDDIGLQISYAPVFSPSSLPVSFKSLVYERSCLLFNLAAHYSKLAYSQAQASDDGLKRAKTQYENAAGVLAYMTAAGLGKFTARLEDAEYPLELSEPFLQGLEALMLSQAQECAWQLGMINSHLYANGVLAKLAEQTSLLYHSALRTFRDASPSIKHIFPKDWLPHIEAKQLHFAAVAQYRKGLDDLAATKYGSELGRLYLARDAAKKGYDISRRAGVTSAVMHDIKSLLDVVEKDIVKKERDNDLIYHQDVLDANSLPAISSKNALVVGVKVPQALNDPAASFGSDGIVFGELASWGALEAIKIYNHNKDNLVLEQIVGLSVQLDDKAVSTLRSLNLPAALEVLERPVGLPPSLLKKAEEVRTEDGVTRVETSIENVQTLAESVRKLLTEAMDILDQEATEDEQVQEGSQLKRQPSHEANTNLIETEQRYRSILDEAAASDELVRDKWDEWETNIMELTWEESLLEASIPTSTVSLSSASGGDTQKHARVLRVNLEALEDFRRSRSQLVHRAQRLSEADDIKPLILKKATGFEKFTEVQPSMFSDISEAEMAKYDRFIGDIEEIGRKEAKVLEEITNHNKLFLQSRRDDPTLKDREHALQTLDLAYHKYREITRNLDEGVKFYNDLTDIISRFKLTCEDWSRHRHQEIEFLTASLSKAPVRQETTPVRVEEPIAQEEELEWQGIQLPSPAPTPTSSPAPKKKSAFNFPAPDSAEWESVQLPPAPTAQPISKKKKAPALS